MKRIWIVLAVVAMSLVGASGPARADYHALCSSTPTLPADGQSFTSTGTQLRAAMFVTCYGRTITIQKFQVLSVATQQVVASLSVPLVCSDTCTGLQTQIFAPLAAGYYEVSSQFFISGNAFSNSRQSEYLFTGSGQPQPICPFTFGVRVSCV